MHCRKHGQLIRPKVILNFAGCVHLLHDHHWVLVLLLLLLLLQLLLWQVQARDGRPRRRPLPPTRGGARRGGQSSHTSTHLQWYVFRTVLIGKTLQRGSLSFTQESRFYFKFNEVMSWFQTWKKSKRRMNLSFSHTSLVQAYFYWIFTW